MLRFLAIILAFYLIYLGATSLLLIYQNFSEPSDPTTELLRFVGAIIPFLVSIVYFYGSYALIKGQRDKFPALLGFFLMQLIIALAIAFSGLSGRVLLQINPIIATLGLGGPVIIFLILIINRGRQPKTNPLQTARNTLGEHIEHLSDEELKDSLKR